MARAGRRGADAESLPGVKLFVASTGWPYKPSHSPPAPLLLFAGGPSQVSNVAPYLSTGHVCRRHAELVKKVAKPEHEDVFIIDLSKIGTPEELQAEMKNPGKVVKMLVKWFIKFNCTNATCLAHGEDAGLVAALLESLDSSKISRILLSGAASVSRKVVEKLTKSIDIEICETTEAFAKAWRGPQDPGYFEPTLEDLYFMSVDFTLDPRSKQLVQKAKNITSVVMMPISDIKLPREMAVTQPKVGAEVMKRLTTKHTSQPSSA